MPAPAFLFLFFGFLRFFAALERRGIQWALLTNNNTRTVEVYVLDYQGNLYGSELKIDIVARLRGERQFNTAEELKQQITEDIKQGKKILNAEMEAKYARR